MKKLIVLVLILLLCIVPVCANATLWYVDNAASGTNAGTSWTNAWESFADITWGVGGVVAGDTLYISGGASSQTYNETLTIGASGEESNRITIQNGQDANHTGTVVIDAQNSRTRCIYVADYDYLTIDGFTLTDAPGTGTSAGIELYRSDYVTLQNLTITEFRRYGIMVNGYTPNYCNEIKLLDSTIENEDGTYNYQTDNVYVQYTIGFEMGRNTIVHNYNGYSDQHADAFQANFIDGVFDLHDNWVETAGASGAGVNNNNWIMGYLDGTIRIWNNVVLGSEGAVFHAMQIRGNDSGYSNTLEMYNNYVEARYSNQYAVEINGPTNTFKNNIFVGINYTLIYFGNGVTTPANIDYNIYYRSSGTTIAADPSGKTWAAWQSAGYDANGYNVDPSLDAGYAPDDSGDPTVDTGTSISGTFTDDKDQVTRPQGNEWDIGAYEFEGIAPALSIQGVSIQ